jgi:hypothetical protein
MKKDKEEKKTQVSLLAVQMSTSLVEMRPCWALLERCSGSGISEPLPLEILNSHSGFSYSDTYIVALCCGNKPWTSTSVVPAASLR